MCVQTNSSLSFEPSLSQPLLDVGFHLHRQSSVDPVPPLSTPPGSFPAEKPADNKPHTRNIPVAFLSSQFTHISKSILFLWSSRGTQSAVKHPSLKMTLEFLFFRIWPPLPLVCQSCLCAVPRSQCQVSVYFAISFFSAPGTSVTRFTSNPSWGWSSSLLVELYLHCLDGDKFADPAVPSVSEDIDNKRITVYSGRCMI